MVNKEVYENLTKEKLCFCDTRPDKSIKKVIEYLWWDEKKDYYSGEWGCDEKDHLFNDLIKINDWMKYSINV